MIEFIKKDLLQSKDQAIINTVNTKGIMGKGLALCFKQKFPANYKSYRKYCEKGLLKPGGLLIFHTDLIPNYPEYIINFATKDHWRNPSRLSWIETGLDNLKNAIIDFKIHSISIPPLGCGQGKLDWNVVKLLIIKKLYDLEHTHITIYEP